MRFTLILLAIIFFTISCSKEDGILEGQILEEHYNIPVEAVGFEIISVPKFGGSEQFEARGNSDNSGHFKINFNYKSTRQYELNIRSPKLYKGGTHTYITSKKTNKDFILSSATKVKFRIKNNQANEIRISISSDEAFEGISNSRIKANSDSTLFNIINTKGFGQSAFTFSITSNQNTTQILHDTISIFTKTDTIIHLIEIN